MSTAVFPTLAGLTWNSLRTPSFNSQTQTADSGKEVRYSAWAYPRWKWELTFEMLRDDTVHNELKQLVGFFLARRGKFDSFLFLDPDDNQATAQPIATGDGVTTSFQLVRSYSGFTEPVYFPLTGTVTATVNGTLTAITVNTTTGMITFSLAPAAGAAIQATFQFYYSVRFDQDEMDLRKFMYQLWELKTLDLIQVK